MAIGKEQGTLDGVPSLFGSVIQEHLELAQRNAALEFEMPLTRYMENEPSASREPIHTERHIELEDTIENYRQVKLLRECDPSPTSQPKEHPVGIQTNTGTEEVTEVRFATWVHNR